MGWRRIVACGGAAGVLIIATASSCREATAVVIEARTNVPSALLRGTSFTVGAPGGTEDAEPTTVTSSVDGSGLVGTLVVVPGSDDDAPLSVKVVAGVDRAPALCRPPDYKGCIVARRALRYRPHVRLSLPIRLEVECKDIPCNAVSTCRRGACVDATVDPSSCEEGTPCLLFGERPTGGDDASSVPDGPRESGSDGASSDGSSMDAPADAPKESGGDAGRPGEVACPPQQPCTSGMQCCMNAGAGMCGGAGPQCVLPAFTMRCDGAEDCGEGQSCCLTARVAQCFSTLSCPNGSEVCRVDDDCHRLGETCKNSVAGVYRVCGV